MEHFTKKQHKQRMAYFKDQPSDWPILLIGSLTILAPFILSYWF